MRAVPLLTSLVVVGLCAASVPALAGVNVSLQVAPYTFLSYDPSGNPLSNDLNLASSDGYSNGIDNSDNVGFWTASYSFNLASANDTLSITDLAADDRVVVELNGTQVAAAGINGPGAGTFIFTPTGSQVSDNFLGNGSQSISVTSPFIAGTNTIELIVNNTGSGISGGLSNGPTAVFFTGTVTPNAIPEPVSGALLLSGLVGIAAVVRGRRRQTASARN
jgi:hypothetical protein